MPRLGLKRLTLSTRPQRYHSTATRFRKLAIDMGGVMIKVGQFFSSRVDILPKEMTSELAGLQDEVPPVPFEEIRKVAEAEFGLPLEDKFASFDHQPQAAASLGQVHRACVHSNGDPFIDKEDRSPSSGLNPGEFCVVVKIQRPHIDQIVATDLAALKTVGKWVQRYPPIRKRANVNALVEEFTQTLYEEIDYLAEGRNAETFAANFRNFPDVRVPRVLWPYTSRRVLTLEDVQAIKINDYNAITAAGIDRGEVARRLLNAYLKQIFEDGFVHADPHPGNLFVAPLSAAQLAEEERTAQPVTVPDRPEASAGGNGYHNPSTGVPGSYPFHGNGQEDEDVAESNLNPSTEQERTPWKLTFVDFGMVAHMPANLRAGMRELLIGVGTRDAVRVVRSYQTLGVLLPGADVRLLEKAEDEAFRRFWGKNMTELTHISLEEINDFTSQFRQLIYDMPFQIPEDLILLGRTVGILSGMCTGLDPHFNVWEGLAPYARKLIAEEAMDGRTAWFEAIMTVVKKLAELPTRTETMLQKLERGELTVQDPQLSNQMHHVEGAVRRTTIGLIFAALLMAGIQLYLAGQLIFGGILLAGAALVLLWLLFSMRKN